MPGARRTHSRPGPSASSARAVVAWRPRITARVRIAMVFTGLLVTCGIAMFAALYLVMRYVPTYSLRSAAIDPDHVQENPGTPRRSSAPTDSEPVASQSPEVVSEIERALVVQSTDDILGVLLASSVVVLLVMAIIGAFACWIVAGRLLRPIHELTVAARIASSGSLDHRIGLAGPRDEFTELSDTFDEMLERLQRSFGAYQRFAANASHELQTPLTTVKTVLELARNQPDLDIDRLIDRLDSSNERSIQTVSALLDLAECSPGNPMLDTVDLTPIIQASINAIRPEASTSDIFLDVKLDPTLPSVIDGHAALLERLFTNLLVNAVRHNAPGGHATIEMYTWASDIHGGNSLTIAISNTGKIIDPAMANELTEPFFRASGRVSSSAIPRGHGLGLTLAANIAEAHGTILDIAANPNGGLTVAVTFPATARDHT